MIYILIYMYTYIPFPFPYLINRIFDPIFMFNLYSLFIVIYS